MNNIRKSSINLATMFGGVLVAAIAIWQSYLFATFKDAKGIMDLQGETSHLWWSIGTSLITCVAGLFVFYGFVRYDQSHEMHVVS